MENAPCAANDEEDFGSGQEITGWDADNTSDTVVRNTEQQPIALSNPDIAAGDGKKDAEIEESFEMRKLTDYIEKVESNTFQKRFLNLLIVSQAMPKISRLRAKFLYYVPDIFVVCTSYEKRSSLFDNPARIPLSARES